MSNEYRIRLVVVVVGMLVGIRPTAAQGSYHPGAAPEDSTELQQLFEQGQADARRDLNSGIVKYKWFGLPMRWDPLYAELAAKRYGVEIEFGPDVVMPHEDAYWTGYNGVVVDTLQKEHGASFLSDTYDEAFRAYRRVRPGETPLNVEVVRDVPLTQEAVAAGAGGFVAVRFDIQPNGEPTNFVIVRSLGYGLDERAIEAVGKLRFEPAEDQANAVPVEQYVFPVRFTQK